MVRKLAEDPFKRKFQSQAKHKPLVLTQTEIDRFVTNARPLGKENTQESKLIEKKKQREECKWLTEAFSKQREIIGSEIKKKQYAQDVQCALRELEREARMEIRRKIVLDEAYKKVYEETDRVKNFRAAKNLCEVMKQREEQSAAKSTIISKLADYDAQFFLGTLRDVDNFRDQERINVEKLKENKKQNALNWTKQHNEVLQKKKHEKLKSLRDGFFIKNKFEKEQLKNKEKEEKGKRDILNYKRNLDSQIKEKLLLLEMEQRLDDAEDERAKLFNKAKIEMELEHKKIRSELDKKKAERRKHVADNLYCTESTLDHKEAEILQTAIRQAEDKAREESEKKALKKVEAQKAIDEFYQKEMALKQKKKYEEKLRSFQEKRDMDNLVNRLKDIEDSKQQKHLQLEAEAQHVQKHQIEARKMQDKSLEIEALEDYMLQMKDMDEEEALFQKYAQREIEECEARGIDTYAMKKAARPGLECGRGPLFKNRGFIRPRYYSATLFPEDLLHMNRKCDKQNTKSRLGFVL